MQILFAATVGVRTAQTSSIESHPHESRFSPQPRLDQPIIPNQRKKKNQKAKKKKKKKKKKEKKTKKSIDWLVCYHRFGRLKPRRRPSI